MTKHQPQELTAISQLEVEKRSYQIPTLEQHKFLALTGVSLPIGTLSVPDPFQEWESQ
jgi:hypothetical protein